MKVFHIVDTNVDPQGLGFVRIESAAACLGISSATMFRRLRAGALKKVRVLGRVLIPVAELPFSSRPALKDIDE